MSHAMLSYHHAGSADLLNGSSWDPAVEGSQSFHDFSDASSSQAMDPEELPFSFVHTGAVRDVSLEDYHNQWAGASLSGPVAGETMRRALSRSSTSSSNHKYRITKATSPKSRRAAPGLSHAALASLDFSGSMSPAFSSYQTSPIMGQALFLDTDVVSAPFCQMLPDALSMPCDMTSMHVDPTQITQMRLDTEGLGMQSPCTTWDSFSSPISRTSSPGIWPTGPLTSPPSSEGSPVLVAKVSEHGMLDDDFNGGYLGMMSHREDAGSMHSLHRPSSNDGESARDHPFYKMAAPGSDNLYHCPFEGDPSCSHKPEKLKCNYDKFVDSHLKPYRCKDKGCVDARFSSTACLLRHEREAHAMHGHGEKPFLCAFDGCERSVPGNGFPRQWNLRDHMKRVHHVLEPALLAAASSQGIGSAQSTIKARKRKGDNASEAVVSRKASTKAAAAAADAAAKAAKALNHEWRQNYGVLSEVIPRLVSAEDENVMEHIRKARRQLDNLERLYGNRHMASL